MKAVRIKSSNPVRSLPFVLGQSSCGILRHQQRLVRGRGRGRRHPRQDWIEGNGPFRKLFRRKGNTFEN